MTLTPLKYGQFYIMYSFCLGTPAPSLNARGAWLTGTFAASGQRRTIFRDVVRIKPGTCSFRRGRSIHLTSDASPNPCALLCRDYECFNNPGKLAPIVVRMWNPQITYIYVEYDEVFLLFVSLFDGQPSTLFWGSVVWQFSRCVISPVGSSICMAIFTYLWAGVSLDWFFIHP